MLVVLCVGPVAAPFEAVFLEESEAEVAFFDLVSKYFFAVGVRSPVCGLDYQFVTSEEPTVKIYGLYRGLISTAIPRPCFEIMSV